MSRSVLPGTSLGRGSVCCPPILSCGPARPARPEPAGPRREWGGKAASASPAGRAEAWGCRVGAVQAVQPVTSPWSYRSLVSQVFVSAGWGVVGMAGGAGDASLLLGSLPACCPTVTQPPRGKGGPHKQRSSPHGIMNYCELVAEPCPNQLQARLDAMPQFPPKRSHPAPGATWVMTSVVSMKD